MDARVSKKPKRYTVEQVAEAIREGRLMAYAARRLGCSRTTILNYVKANPELAELVEEMRESTVDEAEGALIKKIREGDTASIIFFLKTQGRSRGYVERQEIQQSGGVTLRIKKPDNWGQEIEEREVRQIEADSG